MSAGPVAHTIKARSGHHLAARVWESAPPARAVVLIAHGHGEHGGSYDEFARVVGAALPIAIVASDFRGHGRSTGKRGVLSRYDDLLDDLDEWLSWIKHEWPGLPVFVFGHSNGALATIRLVETRRPELAGLILSNPSLRLIAEAPLWKLLAGRVLLHLAPWVTFDTGISQDQLTQAADKAAQIDADPLRHQWISPPTFFGMVANGPRAIAEAERITLPTCLILSGADRVADPAAGRAFFDHLAALDKTLLFYETMRHEPIHDVNRATVFAAIMTWLADRIESPDPRKTRDRYDGCGNLDA